MNGNEIINRTKKAVETTANIAKGGVDISKEACEKFEKMVVDQLDQNGDGKLNIDDLIIKAVKMPGVHIDRASFLRRELFKNHPKAVIDKAIETTPAEAGIPAAEIDRIADAVIRLERSGVSGISAALGAAGGWAMAATIPADIIQYYGYTLRAVQKLLYLYGFPEIDGEEEGIQLDSETLNEIILCLGVMNGVAGANTAIKAMAKALADGVEKQLMKKALTQGTIYPIVKQVMKWFGVTLTKATFAGVLKKAIPVVGGVIGGGITFATFRPCCLRLKEVLQDTMLSNPNHVSSASEDLIANCIATGEVIEGVFEECEPEEPKSETEPAAPSEEPPEEK